MTELERELRFAVADWDLLSEEELAALLLRAADALADLALRLDMVAMLNEKAEATMQRVAREMSAVADALLDDPLASPVNALREWSRILRGGQ